MVDELTDEQLAEKLAWYSDKCSGPERFVLAEAARRLRSPPEQREGDVERAREIMEKWQLGSWAECHAAIAVALARVRREERERCAKIAEQSAVETIEEWPGDAFVAHQIAKAIRAGSEPSKGCG